MAARFRHGHDRRSRGLGDDRGHDGHDDVVKVRIVIESGDPRRIGRAGLSERDEADEQAEHQQREGGGHDPSPTAQQQDDGTRVAVASRVLIGRPLGGDPRQ